MIPLVSKLVEKDSRLAATPALRRVQHLASLPSVKIVTHDGYSQSAADVHSIWNVRLWNMHRKHRRFVGLPHLVRNLAALHAGDAVKQVVLRADAVTGLVFYTASDDKLLGAVVSTRTAKDEKRSHDNWLRAMGRLKDKNGQ